MFHFEILDVYDCTSLTFNAIGNVRSFIKFLRISLLDFYRFVIFLFFFFHFHQTPSLPPTRLAFMPYGTEEHLIVIDFKANLFASRAILNFFLLNKICSTIMYFLRMAYFDMGSINIFIAQNLSFQILQKKNPHLKKLSSKFWRKI